MQITSTEGAIVEIDDDRDDLASVPWYIDTSVGYVYRYVIRDGRRRRSFLHHEVLGVDPDPRVRVDHRDRDPLNNRRSNLRICTPSQNAQNRSVMSSRGLPRGVTWKKDKGKWCARAMLNGTSHHLGYHDTVDAAAEVVSTWRAENMTHSEADRSGV